MKIIDEKGKVFGKINIIDLLVILFLLGLSPMLYFSAKLLVVNPPDLTEEIKKRPVPVEKELVVKVIFTNLYSEISGLVKKGDTATGAEILEVITHEPMRKAEVFNNMEPQTYIIAKLKVQGTGIIGGQLKYLHKYILKSGMNMRFATDAYVISGTILTIEENPEK